VPWNAGGQVWSRLRATAFSLWCSKIMVRLVSEKKWIKQVLERYEAIEKCRPETFNLAVDEYPQWVHNLWPTLFGISHPGLKIKNVKKWTAVCFGWHFLG
jgi:hypothetical protein